MKYILIIFLSAGFNLFAQNDVAGLYNLSTMRYSCILDLKTDSTYTKHCDHHMWKPYDFSGNWIIRMDTIILLKDTLTAVSFGRLILSGDLAVVLTKEYKVRFGQTEKITMEQYKEISDFLLTSTLPKDMNRLFEPYNKSVKRIGIEKAFFTTKNELLKYCRITSDMSLIPSKIIDFVTWVELEKNKTTHSNMYNSYPSGYAPYSCRYTYKKNTDL